ncbi:MAG: hypothetical protein HYU98_01355 [Deltaproteobacteria bacterium]|nr:hypothetical protein [Deltaproteobacteria bacterium]
MYLVWTLSSDPDTYIYKLNKRGIKLDKPEYGWQIAVSDLFSWYVGESIYSLANYLIRGKRSGNTASIPITSDVAVSPPLTNLYLTKNGSFFNISTFIFIGGDSIEFSTGVDSYFIGGRLDTMRFGGVYYGIRLGPIEVEPFSYIDVERSSFGYKGFSSGARALFPLTDNAAIRVEGQYSDNDVLESLVKETDGPAGHLGVDIKF